ncbi:hypothetical protein QYF61_025980 [Mycteria americana]|uniref:DAAF9 N-terminal domain-containing protein n=1 Tax=Mycteria americana TaxID=33587 RepID=A0AAN7N4A3_MYCAM|nr:hypothetical protein QYF61_025980 [Mycteria americana]
MALCGRSALLLPAPRPSPRRPRAAEAFVSLEAFVIFFLLTVSFLTQQKQEDASSDMDEFSFFCSCSRLRNIQSILTQSSKSQPDGILCILG